MKILSYLLAFILPIAPFSKAFTAQAVDGVPGAVAVDNIVESDVIEDTKNTPNTPFITQDGLIHLHFMDVLSVATLAVGFIVLGKALNRNVKDAEIETIQKNTRELLEEKDLNIKKLMKKNARIYANNLRLVKKFESQANVDRRLFLFEMVEMERTVRVKNQEIEFLISSEAYLRNRLEEFFTLTKKGLLDEYCKLIIQAIFRDKNLSLAGSSPAYYQYHQKIEMIFKIIDDNLIPIFYSNEIAFNPSALITNNNILNYIYKEMMIEIKKFIEMKDKIAIEKKGSIDDLSRIIAALNSSMASFNSELKSSQPLQDFGQLIVPDELLPAFHDINEMHTQIRNLMREILTHISQYEIPIYRIEEKANTQGYYGSLDAGNKN